MNDGWDFITDRGRPAHVLPSIEHYRQRTSGHSIFQCQIGRWL